MDSPRMGFVEAVKTCLKKSFVFRGRARRSEFWWWTLFSFILGIIISIVVDEIPEDNVVMSLLVSLGVLMLGLYLGIAGFAVAVRRLHDIGRSGWWYGAMLICGVVWSVWLVAKLLGVVSAMGVENIEADPATFGFTIISEMWVDIFIPYILYVIYSIVLLVWYCKDSQPGANKYGENPKEVQE